MITAYVKEIVRYFSYLTNVFARLKSKYCLRCNYKEEAYIDIGSKIKEARLAANLTQEDVVEHLNVSRQTISNWENEKTYPDIISVVKMSDLYMVSLDYLLKEITI